MLYPDFTRQLQTINEFTVEVSPDILNTPGNLWCSPDPAFALSMGIARGISENTPVYLLGFNYCKHDEKDGVYGFKVYDKCLLKQLNHTESDRKVFFSNGTIFNKLNTDQIANGTFSPLDPNFLQRLRTITQSVSVADLTIFDLTQAINNALTIDFHYKYIESTDPFLFTDIYVPALINTHSDETSHRIAQDVLQKRFQQELHDKILQKRKKTVVNNIPFGFIKKLDKRLEELLDEEISPTDAVHMREIEEIRELVKLYQFYSYDSTPNSSGSVAEVCIEADIDILPWMQKFQEWQTVFTSRGNQFCT